MCYVSEKLVLLWGTIEVLVFERGKAAGKTLELQYSSSPNLESLICILCRLFADSDKTH